LTIATLTESQRAELDRNLISFGDARHRLLNQLKILVADWEQAFEATDLIWQHSEDGEHAQRCIQVLRETIRVLDEDCMLLSLAELV